MKCLSECFVERQIAENYKRADKFMSFTWWKEVTHRLINAFTLLCIQSWLSNLMHQFAPICTHQTHRPFLQQTVLQCDICSKAAWLIRKLSYDYLTVNGPSSHFLDYRLTPLHETQNNMCSSGSSHAILHMATFKGFFFSTQALT